ncbi:MAG: HAD family hydrolase [Lachnospiraceae bacterium]|nr:HAD family hydrolase [Lachnospiraceae bacterium]
MIKTVILDIDDTLYEWAKLDPVVVRDYIGPYVKRHFGWTVEDYYRRLYEATDELVAFSGTTGDCRDRIIRYQLMLEKAGFPVEPHAYDLYHLYWDEMLRRIVPYEGTTETLEALRSYGIRIGVCSDNTAELQFRKLRVLGLGKYMDFVVTSAEAGIEKPDPKIFERALQKACCAPEECLFVGDVVPKDVLGPEKAGMRALWFNNKNKPAVKGVTEIHSLLELLEHLD